MSTAALGPDPSSTTIKAHEYLKDPTDSHTNQGLPIINREKAKTMSRDTTTSNIFPFFELPAELRDMIYDESLEDKDDQELSSKLLLKAKNVPRTNMLLVSKQMKEEYEDRASKHSQLIIKAPDERLHNELDDHEPYEIPATLPTAAAKVSHLTLDAYFSDIDQVELGRFVPLIGMVTSPMFNVKTFAIRIVTWIEVRDLIHQILDIFPATATDWVNEMRDQDWLDLPKLHSFKVVDAGDYYYYATQGEEQATKVIAEWTKSTGRLEELAEPKDELLEGVAIPYVVEKKRRLAAEKEERLLREAEKAREEEQKREALAKAREERIQALEMKLCAWEIRKAEKRRLSI